MIYIPAVLRILGVVFFAVCALKESKTTGLYKALNVYGRIRAYLFADCLLLLCGVGAIAFIPVGLLIPDFSIPVIRFVLIGVAGLVVAILDIS